MISVSAVGRLVKDPESRQVGEQTKVSFTVVSNRNYKKGDDWVENPTFLDISVWGGLTESAMRFKKGHTIQVVGRLEQERWKAKDSGEERSKLILNASALESINNKKDEEKETVGAGTESSPF